MRLLISTLSAGLLCACVEEPNDEIERADPTHLMLTSYDCPGSGVEVEMDPIFVNLGWGLMEESGWIKVCNDGTMVGGVSRISCDGDPSVDGKGGTLWEMDPTDGEVWIVDDFDFDNNSGVVDLLDDNDDVYATISRSGGNVILQ